VTDYSDHLPEEVEIGAVRRLEYRTEIVETDGGFEVRNNRWGSPLRTFEVSFPTPGAMKRSIKPSSPCMRRCRARCTPS
jgi:hypothetical protein